MIQSVRLRNYKNISNQDIELERLTVLVGANGSGKTSVLEAIHNAVRAATGDPAKVFGHERHCDWIYTRGGTGDFSITCVTKGGEFFVKAPPPSGFPLPPELLEKGQWTFTIDSPPGTVFEDALQPARSLVFLHFDASELARPSYSDRDPPRVQFNGGGLASVLAFMALNDPESFNKLVDQARQLIPRLKRIRFRKAPVRKVERELVRFGQDSLERRITQTYQGEMILFDFDNAENISARTASEGTMLLLGLLTVLLGPTHPRIVLMDDIEHGLHPRAQKHLVGMLAQIMQTFPDLQLLATAHSPYLLNYLSPAQVRIMATGPDGHAQCGRLTDHPKFATWKDEMAPGEMWSFFGEKWLAEKESAP